jgi:CDP-diacylglycerol--serine O-phosphatidyltransferase
MTLFSFKRLPNVFTSMNLLCGCVALVAVFHGNEILLAGMMFLAAMFDLLDGLTARGFNAYSDFGKEFDSLADMVTFGVVPGMIMYNLFIKGPDTVFLSSNVLFHIFKYFPFIITLFAALRLARFNCEKSSSSYFTGMPTPAAALMITSLPLIVRYDRYALGEWIHNPYFICIFSLGTALLMMSNLKLFALKFHNLSWNDNRFQYLFLIIAVVFFVLFGFTSVPLIIMFYIAMSLASGSRIFNPSEKTS